MIPSARSLDAVNISWTLVAALTLMQFTKVNEAAENKRSVVRKEYKYV